jgi:hypothetical protein
MLRQVYASLLGTASKTRDTDGDAQASGRYGSSYYKRMAYSENDQIHLTKVSATHISGGIPAEDSFDRSGITVRRDVEVL